MRWPWDKRDRDDSRAWATLPLTNLPNLVRAIAKEELEKMAEQQPPAPPTDPTNFTGALVMAIELLKRGAPQVDLHDFNLRVRRSGDDWSISSVPLSARQRHLEAEIAALHAQQERDIETMMTEQGGGDDDGPAGEAPEVGPAPANA